MNRHLALAVVLAASVSAIAVAGYLALHPIWHADQQIAALGDELRASRQRLTQASTEIASLGDRKDQLRLLVDAGDPATVSASLQEQARNAIASTGGQLISAQAMVVDLGGGFHKASLLMRARVDEATLLAFLRAREFAVPPVVVELLEILPMPGSPGVQSLDVNMILSRVVADASAT